MKSIWCIVKKDTRRLCTALCVWFVILVVLRVVGYHVFMADSFSEVTGGELDAIGLTVGLLHTLMAALFAGAVVREDPVVGSHSFLGTRPVGGGHLLMAKVLVVGFAVMLPSTVIDVVWQGAMGISFGTMSEQTIVGIISLAWFVSVGASVSVWLGKRDGGALLWKVAAITLVPVILTMLLITGGRLWLPQRIVVIYWMVIIFRTLPVVGVAALVVLYMTRSEKRGFLALGVGTGLLCILLLGWVPLQLEKMFVPFLPDEWGELPLKWESKRIGDVWSVSMSEPGTWKREGADLGVRGSGVLENDKAYIEFAAVLPAYKGYLYSWNVSVTEKGDKQGKRLSEKKVLCSATLGSVRLERFRMVIPDGILPGFEMQTKEEQKRLLSRLKVEVEPMKKVMVP